MSRPADSRPTDPFSGIQLLSDDAYRSLGSMEAVEWEVPAPEKLRVAEVAPGFLVAVALTALAFLIHRLLPDALPLGAAVLAMVLGILFRNAFSLAGPTETGCRWIVTHLIPVAIVLVGAGLNLGILVNEGIRFLGFMVATVILSTVGAVLLGRLTGVKNSTALLIGAGTGICGSSAILALAPVIDAEEDEILLSVGAINLIGLVALFACIGVAAVGPIEAVEFGILTGSTIHAVPTLAAAAFDHSLEAGQTATLVKMGRVALLVPLVFAVATLRSRTNSPRGSTGKARNLFHFVPWFVWGFVGVAALGTLGLIPALEFPAGAFFGEAATFEGAALLAAAGKLLLALAMAAIGLQVGLRATLQVGGKSLLVAAIVWLTVFGAIGTALLVL